MRPHRCVHTLRTQGAILHTSMCTNQIVKQRNYFYTWLCCYVYINVGSAHVRDSNQFLFVNIIPMSTNLDLLKLSGHFESFSLNLFEAHLCESRLYRHSWMHVRTLYIFTLQGIMLSWPRQRKVLVHIIHYEDIGLQHCLTAKPSGIQSTELSIVLHPEHSLLRVKSQLPFLLKVIFSLFCFFQQPFSVFLCYPALG